MVWVRCARCLWEWKYKGGHRRYATCPSCRRQVNLEKESVEHDQS